MELLDHRAYYRALQSHDARFDGHVFVGCTSTGIYCRQICPTRPPKFENSRFFASASTVQCGPRPFAQRLESNRSEIVICWYLCWYFGSVPDPEN